MWAGVYVCEGAHVFVVILFSLAYINTLIMQWEIIFHLGNQKTFKTAGQILLWERIQN